MRVRGSRRSEQPEYGTSGKNVIGHHVRERSNVRSFAPCTTRVRAMPQVMTPAPFLWQPVPKRVKTR
jgi:hypothetical protein